MIIVLFLGRGGQQARLTTEQYLGRQLLWPSMKDRMESKQQGGINAAVGLSRKLESQCVFLTIFK